MRRIWAATAALAAGLALAWALHARGVGVAPPAARPAIPPPAPLVPADRALRLALIGTSLTAGRPWPVDLTARLGACRSGGVVLIRHARPGANSAWGQGALSLALAEQPDLVVIEFATNDASLFHGLTLADSRRRHLAMLAMARAQGLPVFLALPSPASGTNHWLERPGLAAYQAMVRDLAAGQGAGLIDLIPAWAALGPGQRAALMPDGLHPTDQGHARLTLPGYLAALAPLVCDPGPPNPAG